MTERFKPPRDKVGPSEQADAPNLPDPAEARLDIARRQKLVKRGFAFTSDVKLGENHAGAIKAFAEFLEGKYLLGLRLHKGDIESVDDASGRVMGSRQVDAKEVQHVVGLDVSPNDEMMVDIAGLKPEISDGVASEIVSVLKNGKMLDALFQHVVKPGSFEAKDLDIKVGEIAGQAGAPAELNELKDRLTTIGELMTQDDF